MLRIRVPATSGTARAAALPLFCALALAGCGKGGGGASRPPLPDSLAFTPVTAGLDRPTVITHAGDGSSRLLVAEQGGRVLIVTPGAAGIDTLLDLTDRVAAGGERGLLGVAFPPGFPQKRYFYVDYTREPDGATVLSRFHLADGADRAPADGEEQLLKVIQPYSNHNGGQLAFGPDALLYVGLGDGGGAGDPQGNGQSLETLLGKILRLDVETGAAPYAIPPDNPFAGDAAGRDEIWALGLRNPWRFSFDRATGDLYVADVGQATWEEIDFQAAGAAGGANYGWSILEGPDCYEPPADCQTPAGYVPPVAFYSHDLGCSISGGYVYRGPGNDGLRGAYVYGDYCSGRIWALGRTGGEWRSRLLADTQYRISTFGEDEDGRLYLADYATGTIYRVDAR